MSVRCHAGKHTQSFPNENPLNPRVDRIVVFPLREGVSRLFWDAALSQRMDATKCIPYTGRRGESAMKVKRWLTRGFLVAIVVVYAPYVWFWATVPVIAPQAAKPADAALIFGALVRSGEVSALHAERLDTGAMLWGDGVVDTLVASNAVRAAGIMKDYLVTQGVPAEAVEIDGQAQATPDTCVAEAARPTARSVILISQAYHLPRIALQCRRLGVTGQYVKSIREPSVDPASLWTKIRVRAVRYTREAVLVWAELLGQYRVLERATSP